MNNHEREFIADMARSFDTHVKIAGGLVTVALAMSPNSEISTVVSSAMIAASLNTITEFYKGRVMGQN